MYKSFIDFFGRKCDLNDMKLPFFSILIISFFLLTGCHGSKKDVKPPAVVTAFRIAANTIPADFQFVGVAKSSHPVEIRSRVEGYLQSINYSEGSMVDPDSLLFRIDPSQFEASLQLAEGELARQKAILWGAERSLKRLEPLYEQKAASQKDRDDALAQVLAGEASVISTSANVTQAKLNLSYTYIKSPIKGLTTRAIYREGNLITPSINGLLTSVSVIDPIWVVFSISDQELLQAKAEGNTQRLILPKEQNYTVKLKLADGSLFPSIGKVNFLAPVLDPDTGSLVVRSEFNNPKGDLLPGQFVSATISGAMRPDAIIVPQSAVFQGNHGMYVFVIDENQIVSLREVKVGQWYQTYWIITEGVHPGELVVSDGTNKVQNNSKVVISSITSYVEDRAKQPETQVKTAA